MLSDAELEAAYYGGVKVCAETTDDDGSGWDRAGLRAVETAVRADMQREVQTVEYQYGVRHDRTGEISTTLTEAASRTYATGTDVVVHPGGREEAFPRTLVRRALGPWLPVTPSAPNQTGAEHAE